MTNQSREAFEKLLERARKIAYPPYPGFSLHIDLNWVEKLMEDTWQAALSEGRRQGEQDAMKDMQMLIEKRAHQLMLEHYDADLYKRALEEHLKLCTRSIVIIQPDKAGDAL